MVDLRKAYLQLQVKKELWPYQTVKFEGQQYCLTRLGFGLNVAPLALFHTMRVLPAPASGSGRTRVRVPFLTVRV